MVRALIAAPPAYRDFHIYFAAFVNGTNVLVAVDYLYFSVFGNIAGFYFARSFFIKDSK